MINILTDPRIFNFIIIALFLIAGIRWTFAGDYWQALYWYCGFGINIAVTFK